MLRVAASRQELGADDALSPQVHLGLVVEFEPAVAQHLVEREPGAELSVRRSREGRGGMGGFGKIFEHDRLGIRHAHQLHEVFGDVARPALLEIEPEVDAAAALLPLRNRLQLDPER